MTYTFGGAVGSRCNWTSSITVGNSGSTGVMTGWFYPTTLTATRRYFSAGTIFGARIAGTTSEIEMLTDNATTDGVWVTSGAGITTNSWWFVAVAWVVNDTGPLGSWRVWVGTPSIPPQEVSVSQTTGPVGSLTGSTNCTFGNTGSNNVSFQGELADLSLGTSATGGAASNAFGLVGGSTAITNDEAEWLRRFWVTRHWQGDPGGAVMSRTKVDRGTNAWDYFYWSATPLAYLQRNRDIAGNTWIVPTLTSSVVSVAGSPRPAISLVNAGAFTDRG